jgi:DNA-directed RNA polymerase specialized sigma24 family protein
VNGNKEKGIAAASRQEFKSCAAEHGNLSLLVTRKKDWTLTKEAFEQLLASLDANRDRAGQKYENLRRKLIEFFEARGSNSPADHTDETINRVARRIAEGEEIASLEGYFYGVARLLLKETLRARDRDPIALELASLPTNAVDDEAHERRRREEEQRVKCFEECLSKLFSIHRILIVEYYREEKGVKIEQRKRQAEALGMSLNALRCRACRIRVDLAQCINSCMAHSEDTRNRSFITDY